MRKIGSFISTRCDIYSRVLLAHYFWFVLVVFTALLVVVTALNVASEVAVIWNSGNANSEASGTRRVSRYVFLRLLDNGSQVLPISVLLGLAWGEVTYVASGRLQALRSLGLTIRQRVKPIVWLVAGVLVAELLLSCFVRPYAFMSLSRENLGEYGTEYKKIRSRTEWLAFGDLILQTKIKDGSQPVLTDVVLYYFNTTERLLLIETAESIRPSTDGTNGWQMIGIKRWPVGEMASQIRAHPSKQRSKIWAEAVFPVPLSELWLSYRYIRPKYIPQYDLIALSRASGIPSTVQAYGPWLIHRFFEPAGFALVTLIFFCLFSVALDRFGLVMAALTGFGVTYVGYFGVKTVGVVITAGIVSPFGSAAFSLICLAGLAALLFHWAGAERRSTG